MVEDTKVRENRLRRTAERRGYLLEKSRRRDPQAVEYNGFMLLALKDHSPVFGIDPHPYSATIEDIDQFFSPIPIEECDVQLKDALVKLKQTRRSRRDCDSAVIEEIIQKLENVLKIIS